MESQNTPTQAVSTRFNPCRLPLTHPEYRYPLSRHPYLSKLQKYQGLAYSDNETETQRGRWLSFFSQTQNSAQSTDRKLCVEIGCAGGQVIIETASQNPEKAYVGLDWKFKAIHRGAEKASERGLENLKFVRGYADRIDYMFGPEEIDELRLYFPDPWPRRSQWRNRFINPENLKKLASLVKPSGLFHIKTDHAGYFEWMEEALSQTPGYWEVTRRSTHLHEGHPDPTRLQVPEVTLFERIFIRKGVPIQSLWLKRAESLPKVQT